MNLTSNSFLLLYRQLHNVIMRLVSYTTRRRKKSFFFTWFIMKMFSRLRLIYLHFILFRIIEQKSMWKLVWMFGKHGKGKTSMPASTSTCLSLVRKRYFEKFIFFYAIKTAIDWFFAVTQCARLCIDIGVERILWNSFKVAVVNFWNKKLLLTFFVYLLVFSGGCKSLERAVCT